MRLTSKHKRMGAQVPRLVAVVLFCVLVGVSGGCAASRPAAKSNHPCGPADLEVERGTPGATMGTLYEGFTFRNVSGRMCTMRGFPRVELRSASGMAVAKARPSTDALWSVTTLFLPPDGSAAFTVVDVERRTSGSGSCNAGRLAIYPPGSQTTVKADATAFVCSRRLFLVSAVHRPGR